MNVGGSLIRDKYEELTHAFKRAYASWIDAKNLNLGYEEIEHRWAEYVMARDIRDSHIKANLTGRFFEDG